MSYRIKVTGIFERKFRKLDSVSQRFISRWIKKNLQDCEDPRLHGRALAGPLKSYWRYRIGDYRLIAEIHDKELLIIAIDIGHRKEIYRQ